MLHLFVCDKLIHIFRISLDLNLDFHFILKKKKMTS